MDGYTVSTFPTPSSDPVSNADIVHLTDAVHAEFLSVKAILDQINEGDLTVYTSASQMPKPRAGQVLVVDGVHYYPVGGTHAEAAVMHFDGTRWHQLVQTPSITLLELSYNWDPALTQYLTNNVAGRLTIGPSGLSYSYAVSGTAGASITPKTAMLIDASGQVGLGSAPGSSWSSSYQVLQLIGASLMSERTFSSGITMNLTLNAFFDGTNWKYIGGGAATNYYQQTGAHVWRTTAVGSAFGTITWTEAMKLEADTTLRLEGSGWGQLFLKRRGDLASLSTGIFFDTNNGGGYYNVRGNGGSLEFCFGATQYSSGGTVGISMDGSGNLFLNNGAYCLSGNGVRLWNVRVPGTGSLQMFDATGGFVAAEFGLGGPSFTTTLTVHGSFICDGFYSDSGGPKFSTYTASPGIAQTGYISVRDSAGTTRRLLVG